MGNVLTKLTALTITRKTLRNCYSNTLTSSDGFLSASQNDALKGNNEECLKSVINLIKQVTSRYLKNLL